jgi:hypothetical protein
MVRISSILAVALLAFASGCSKQESPTPAPAAKATATTTTGAPSTSNYVAPINDDPGTGGGGGGGGCVDGPPTQAIKDRIKAIVQKEARLRGWSINTTIAPPDGITYGLGCETSPYAFSVDLNSGTYVSGLYNSGDGTYTIGQ